MERLCLDCNTLIKGRADKKFCDDQCRSNYNNRLQVENRSFLKQVNHILKKNREILKAKTPTGKAMIKKEQLAQKGFNFTFHTHTYTTQKSQTYVFCYEYGYLALDNDELLLVKREQK